MSKSKLSPALFEVMRRDLETKSTRMAQPFSDSATASSSPAPTKLQTDLNLQNHESPRSIQAQGNRLHFSVTTLTLSVILFGILFLSYGAFEIGKTVGRKSAALEMNSASDPDQTILSAQQQPPDNNVLQDLDMVNKTIIAQEARQERAAQPATTGFVDGLNYIWIDTFTTQEEAVNAQNYLKDHGLETIVFEKTGKWRLFSANGFDYRIPEEKNACEQWVSKIKELGQHYMKSGGRYRFDCLVKLKKAEETW